jgi:hypothetical protein
MDEHEQERSEDPGRRCDDVHCPAHISQVAAVAKHSGQWKMLLLILGVAIVGILKVMSGIQESAHTIETTVVAYMASHQAESRDGFRRITQLEGIALLTEERLDKLERIIGE